MLDTGNHDLLATKTLDAYDDDDDDDDQSHNVDDEYGHDHEDDYDDWQSKGEEGDGLNDSIDGGDEIVKQSGTGDHDLSLYHNLGLDM